MDGTKEHKWDQRWQDRVPSAASATTAAAAWIPGQGRAIDLAGGISGDAFMLAATGLDVTVADISSVALDAVRSEADRQGLMVQTRHIDLEREPVPPGPWAVVTIGNYFDPAMMAAVIPELAVGGIIAVVVATTTNLERHHHPSRRFLAAPGQVRECLSELHELAYDERWRANGRHEVHAVMTNDPVVAVRSAKQRWRRIASEVTPSGFDFATASAKLSKHLVDFLGQRPGPGPSSQHRVLVYDAMDGEPSLAEAIATWPASRLAITRTPDSGPLTVHGFEAPVERHRYGYAQPRAGSPEVGIDALDAVAVPAVALDHDGGRLGRGRGYYDRLLSDLPPSALRIGIAFDHMVVDRVPTEAHDISMTHLATESGIHQIGTGHR